MSTTGIDESEVYAYVNLYAPINIFSSTTEMHNEVRLQVYAFLCLNIYSYALVLVYNSLVSQYSLLREVHIFRYLFT